MKTIIQKIKKAGLPILSSSVLALGAVGFSAPTAFADHHCRCDQKCSENCEHGKTEKCTCTTCDCAKGKGCSHGKCGLKHKDEKKAGE